MKYSSHERQHYISPNFPVTFLNYIESNNVSCVYEHWHESIEMNYIVKGSGSFSCDFKSFPVSEGTLIFIHPHEIHTVETVNETLEFYCLIIDQSVLEELVPNIHNITFKKTIQYDEFLSSVFQSIGKEFKNKLYLYENAMKADLVRIFIYLLRYFSVENAPVDKKDNYSNKVRLLKNALNYMNSNFHQNISLDDICNHIGYSKYYFCRIFKEMTNKTYTEYLNILRCHKAHNLLTLGKYNVTQVAEICGFSSASYFSIQYKKYFGVPPSKHQL